MLFLPVYFILQLSNIHLYGMNKERFYSELFRREIHKSEPEFKQKALAEALYRVYKLEIENCTCMQCQADLKKFKSFLDKRLNTKK